MDPTDLPKPVIERTGGTIRLGRLIVKRLNRLPSTRSLRVGWRKAWYETHVSIPGNQASVVMFYVVVVPRFKMGGWPEGMCQLPRVKVQIQHPMLLDTRKRSIELSSALGEARGYSKHSAQVEGG